MADAYDFTARSIDGHEQSLGAYKRGAELLKFCQVQLADAQQQVKVLEGGALKNFADGDGEND